jgi:biotin carboxyl carrier protein
MEKETNKWITLNKGEYLVSLNGETLKISVIDGETVKINDESYPFGIRKKTEDMYILNLFGTDFEVALVESHESRQTTVSERLSSVYHVDVNRSRIKTVVNDQRSIVAQSWLKRKSHNQKTVAIYAPMPGLITKVMAIEGSTINKGSVLLILEAMKMENEIRALQDCRIESILVRSGTTVERNDELLRIIEL